MSFNKSRVDVREPMCDMYCGVMAWLSRVVGDHVDRFRASY